MRFDPTTVSVYEISDPNFSNPYGKNSCQFGGLSTKGIAEEVPAKMAAAQGYSDVIFLRGGHLSCHFLRKAPLTCQSDLNDRNKNIYKGKMFWLTR